MEMNRIRLSESQLRQIIEESVKKVLKEIGDTEGGQNMLGYNEKNVNPKKTENRRLFNESFSWYFRYKL